MQPSWWHLPGPGAYVSRIVKDLRDGKNVVLCMPEHSPDGVGAAVREVLGESDWWLWHTLNIAEDGGDMTPAELLFSRFVPDVIPHAIQNAESLLEQRSFGGRLVWLEGLNGLSWPRWKEFLVEYEHAYRSFPTLERSQFCVTLTGGIALDPPPDAVCLSHHYWRGWVSATDMLLYSSMLVHATKLSILQKRLAAAIAGSLALWDPTVSQRLAEASIETILNPGPILRQIADEREWSFLEKGSQDDLWQSGMLDQIDGRVEIHSAALILGDPDRELERRIWSAEVGVLFPFVEERRRDILRRFGAFLTVPYLTRFGEVITDVRDLELGHIEAQLANNGLLLNSEIVRLLGLLRGIRNSLSHLEPLPSHLLRWDQMSRPLDNFWEE